jgi:hypothetical protein
MPVATEYHVPAGVADELRSACASATWSRNPAELLKGLKAVAGFELLRPSVAQDHFSENPGRILDGKRTVAASYRDWAREQLAAHGGDARAVWSEHAAKAWTLTWTSRVVRHYWLQTGPHPWNGIQLTISVVEEFPGGLVFRPEPSEAPRDREELLNPHESRKQDTLALGPGRYNLEAAIDMEAFYRLGQRLHAEALERCAQRRVIVRSHNGETSETTWGKVAPEGFRYMWRVQRWFEDWEFSSAGRSGAVAGHHWAFQLSDWDPGAAGPGRVLDFVPMWSHTARVARIENVHRLTDEALLGKLLALDNRTGGVPFGWYFYMLHGNLVSDIAAHRVLRAANEGAIELPAHDLQVLNTWAKSMYGF